ncbi:unnamed protein product [Chondrus crispus]|uniref:AAA+ ATPase domain-containing protein n=1 Tax=Chondrus crispus TaxID=2769 RepID=R7QCT9_CHOCR|nr:unnamed protein product [Chondrus crispus]CDF35573.1 unnamed protein product [Chondrus crispus]|eukprot:XP_005715392.1 unnamed protein product [Chondrus crispus]
MSRHAETDALKAVLSFLNVDREALECYGATPPRALLLSGPPGVGKTKAVHLAAEKLALPVFTVVPGQNVIQQLHDAFRGNTQPTDIEQDHAAASSRIIFLDEVDAICPLRSLSTSTSSSNTRITSVLLSFIDPPPVPQSIVHTKSPAITYVIAATNRPNAIDPTLRRPGRFDLEVSLLPPTLSDRLSILSALEPNGHGLHLLKIAERTAGYVPADLDALCKFAHQIHARQTSKDCEPDLEGYYKSFDLALAKSKPSVLRDSLAVEVPRCTWDMIGGLADVKRRLKMAVEWPLRYPGTFQRLGLKAPRGILLYGPPGCSKTTLVRAAASESHAVFMRMNGADVYSCYLGEAERILREAFASARAAAPCILFLDEIDAIVGKRSRGGEGQPDGNGVQERVLTTLLTEMDGIVSASGVLVVGATNRLDLLDDALLRPGRFDDILQVGLPDESARLQILQIHCSKLPLADDVHLADIAKRAIGKSGADLMSVCKEASLAALREHYRKGISSIKAPESSPFVEVRARHFMSSP